MTTLATMSQKPEVVHDKAGLRVVRYRSPKRLYWWCTLCYGNKPGKGQIQVVPTLDDAVKGYELHRAGTTHASSRTTAYQIRNAVKP